MKKGEGEGGVHSGEGGTGGDQMEGGGAVGGGPRSGERAPKQERASAFERRGGLRTGASLIQRSLHSFIRT